MKEYLCAVNGNEFIKVIESRNYREAAKRCAWEYVNGKEQRIQYLMNVSVIREEKKDFRVKVSIYPHFEINEGGSNTFMESLINK